MRAMSLRVTIPLPVSTTIDSPLLIPGASHGISLRVLDEEPGSLVAAVSARFDDGGQRFRFIT